MPANGAKRKVGAAVAAPQSEVALFPSHLARLIAQCLEADFNDEEHRGYVKKNALPLLVKHRRDLLMGSRDRWLERSEVYRRDLLQRSKVIRSILQLVHDNLKLHEASNIVDFASFRCRSRQRELA